MFFLGGGNIRLIVLFLWCLKAPLTSAFLPHLLDGIYSSTTDLGDLTLFNCVFVRWDITEVENRSDTDIIHPPLEQTGTKIYP